MDAREVLGYGMLCFVSILGVVNPVRATATFAVLSDGWEDGERIRAVRRSILIAAGILFAAAWVGNHIILYAGIQLGGFRVASGIVLLTLVIRQFVQDQPLDKLAGRWRSGQQDRMKLAVAPLAVPLLAGVGPVATVVLYSGETWEMWRRLVTMGTLALTLIITYAMLRGAARIQQGLGELGARFLSHLLALTVAAWAVDFTAVGIRDLLPLILGTPPAR